jgi:hypothetical protein
MSSTPVYSLEMPPAPAQAGRHDRARRRDERLQPLASRRAANGSGVQNSI